MEEQEARRLLAAARVARLATTSPGGRPHVVPLCFVLEGGTIYSAVDRKPKRTSRLRRLENAHERPPAAVLADHYEEDWSRLWWVRADGDARILEAGEEAGRALRLLALKYPQYAAQPPPGPVLAIDVERWSGWAAS